MHDVIVISIQHDPKEMLANLKNQGYAREALFHFLPNYAASWWLVPAVIGGVYRGLADRKLRRLAVPFLVWLVGYMTELIAFGDRLHSNAYYFVLAPAPMAFFGALGLGALVQVLGTSTHRTSVVLARAAMITAITPLGVLSLKPPKWDSLDVGSLTFMQNKNVWTSDLALGILLALTIGAFAFAASIRPKRIPTWAGLPLVALFLASSYAASQTTYQFLRFYSAIEERATTRRDLSEIRAAIDKYSTPSDRVVVSPEDFIWLYYSARNGWGIDHAKTTGLEQMRARSGRLYLHLEPSPPKLPGKLLVTGSWWRLYCIAADDCPAH
jgi:hypothetical protein